MYEVLDYCDLSGRVALRGFVAQHYWFCIDVVDGFGVAGGCLLEEAWYAAFCWNLEPAW